MSSLSSSQQRLEMVGISENNYKVDEDQIHVKGGRRSFSSDGGGGGGGGCFVSSLVGFAFVLMAVLLSVGVGLIVFFAAPGRDIKCTCDYPPEPTVSQEEQWKECHQLSVARNECKYNTPHRDI